MTESERRRIEQRIGRGLPSAYADFYLLIERYDDSDMWYREEDLDDLRALAVDILCRDNMPALSEQDFVFWGWKDAQFAMFSGKLESDDPLVRHFVEGLGYVGDEKRFSEWIGQFELELSSGSSSVGSDSAMISLAKKCSMEWEAVAAAGLDSAALPRDSRSQAEDALTALRQGIVAREGPLEGIQFVVPELEAISNEVMMNFLKWGFVQNAGRCGLVLK
ncbi:MAG: hypothetical protein AAF591_12300 [Verrucomicrobiota bacterium]